MKKKNVLLGLGLAFSVTGVSYAAPDLPLLQQGDLVYTGAFRVPQGKYGASALSSSLTYGGPALTYNPARNSLFMIGSSNKEKMLIELGIPAPKISTNINDLNTAAVVQPSIDITNGNWNNLREDGTATTNGGSPGGFLVDGDRLIGSAYGYYDGGSDCTRSHFVASPNWSSEGTQFGGMHKVGVNPVNPASANGGFVGGPMAHIPQEWQPDFEGRALTGIGAIAVLSRTSAGPSAWVFDPANVGLMDPAPATMVLGYPSGHPTLGLYSDAPSLYYNRTTELRGMIFPAGSRSVLFFGRHGLGTTGQGDSCYGSGTSDPTLDNTFHSQFVTQSSTSLTISQGTKTLAVPEGLAVVLNAAIILKPVDNPKFHIIGAITSYQGGTLSFSVNDTLGSGTYSNWEVLIATATGTSSVRVCFDPTSADKGGHAYPYVYRVWAYDAGELLKVKKGTINAATGLPYKPWDIMPYGTWDLRFPLAIENAHIVGAAYDPASQRIFISQYSGDKVGYSVFPLIHVYQLQIPAQPTTPDVTPPTIGMTSPSPLSTVAGKTTVAVNASDNVGVRSVELYVNGTLKMTETLAPYSFTWDTTSLGNGAYTLTTKAYDNAGNVAVSAPVPVTVNNYVPDVTAPVVTTFTMPAAATTLTVPVTFAATDQVGVTGYLVTESSTPPSVDLPAWISTAPTSFTFSGEGIRKAYAWAKDAAGNVSNGVGATVTITLPDLTAPTTAITAPANAATVGGSVTMTATATDNFGVTRVDFLINGNVVGTSSSGPYSYDWNTRSFANGTYIISSKAYDAAGNVAPSQNVSVTVFNDTTAPTVSITSPAGGALAGTVAISANATDNVAVTKVEFYLNGLLVATSSSAPYSFNWDTTATSNGAYTLTAKAYDAAGNVGQTADVAVTVFNDLVSPTITFASPISTYVYGSKVNINVSAADNVAVNRMELYVDGSLRTTVSYNSLTVSLPISKGVHTLVVKAYDPSNNVATATKSVNRIY